MRLHIQAIQKAVPPLSCLYRTLSIKPGVNPKIKPQDRRSDVKYATLEQYSVFMDFEVIAKYEGTSKKTNSIDLSCLFHAKVLIANINRRIRRFLGPDVYRLGLRNHR
jgi:hypothetical protein